MDLKDIRKELESLKGRKSQIETEIEENETLIRKNKRELLKYEQAKEIVREVGIKTQKQLQYHISDITSLALEAIFEDPYELELEFIQRRNKTECDIYFSRDGERVKPLDSSGGGAIDVASFALRVACWSLNYPHTRNTIILDEPLKWIDVTLRDKASNMLKEISQKLNIQFIIVTHDPILSYYADKVFEVVQPKSGRRKGISRVKISI